MSRDTYIFRLRLQYMTQEVRIGFIKADQNQQKKKRQKTPGYMYFDKIVHFDEIQ